MKAVAIWLAVIVLVLSGVVGTRIVLERAEYITLHKEKESRRPSRAKDFIVRVLSGVQKVAEIRAEEGTEDIRKSISYFTGIRDARFFDEGKEVARIVRAKDVEGTYNRFIGLLEVKGEIVLQTRGKYRLQTKHLFYNKGLNVMICPNGITLTDGKGARFSAQYAIFIPNSESAMMFGKVRGTVTRKTTIRLNGDFLRHSASSPWTDLFGGSQAELQMPQTSYYTQLLPPELKPTLKASTASLTVKGYRMEGNYIQIDREASRVSLINEGIVKVGKSIRLESRGYNPRTHSLAKLDYYWDRGYLFAKGNITFSGESGESGEADEATYIASDHLFQFAGNVTIKKPEAGWLYSGEDAREGTLRADAVTISEEGGEVSATGAVKISEGDRLLEGALVRASAMAERIYAEKGRLVTEEQELTAKAIEITPRGGWAQGQVRMVRRSDALDVSASKLKWSGSDVVELEGMVTGTRGEDRFSASQVTLSGKRVNLIGKAELRREDRSVMAERITAEQDTVTAQGGATVLTEGLTISAEMIQFSTQERKGTAQNLSSIIVQEGIGEAKGPARIYGEEAEFSWNPSSLRIPGNASVEMGAVRIMGEDFLWADGQGTIQRFTLQRKTGFVMNTEFTMTGERLSFKGRSYEGSGSVRVREGNLELQGEQIRQDSEGNVKVTGRPLLRLPSRPDPVQIESDELDLNLELRRIDFTGNVQVSRGPLRAKAESAYILLGDNFFVLEKNVDVERSGGDTLRCQRMIVDLATGQILMEGASGQVHY